MRVRSLIAALFASLASVGAAVAQPERPESARRVVRTWDFEDAVSDPRPVPRNWFRAQDNPPERTRPGFPKEWNLALMDATVAHSGSWSVKLPTQGGSTSLMLARGVIPAMPGGDYLVTAQIRTDGLVHARARIVGRLLDDRLSLITTSESGCAPIITEGDWAAVRLVIHGSEDAAWVQLELQLLQPDQLDTAPAARRAVREQDVSGAAWFDDIQLFQLPRLELTSTAPGGVAVAPQTPELVIKIQDLTGEPLDAELRVFDIDSREVARETITGTSGAKTRVWRPELPAFGWYRASMRVGNTQGLVGEAHTDFVWVPARGSLQGSEHAQGFAMIFPALTGAALEHAPTLVERAGSGSTYVAVRTGDEASIATLQSVVERLIEDGQDVTFMLERVPTELAREARTDADDVLGLLANSGDAWAPSLNPVLSAFGERVRRYQVGAVGNASAFWREDLDALVPQIEQRLRMLIPRPIVAVPWVINQKIHSGAQSVSSLTMLVPQAIPCEAIPDYAASWPSSVETTLVIEPPDAATYGERASATELARRAIVAWSAGVSRVGIRAPWRWDAAYADRAQPTPALGVWRTLVEELRERDPAGVLPVGDGITAIIAQGTADSALIAWNEGREPRDAVLRGYLGDHGIRIRDLFGNTRAIAAKDGEYTIPLTSAPVFVEGIDANLARFRGGLRVDPAFIPARAQKHEMSIIISNPWPISVSGRLRIADPAEWDISPRVASFSIPGGGEQRVPLTVAFGLGEEAGPRLLTIEVNLSAERLYPTMRVVLPVEIGLETVQLQPSLRLINGAGGPRSDLEVSLLVTNTGDKPVSLESFALAPGFRGQQAPISTLGPGQSALRRFVFEGAAKPLHAKTIRVGLKEIDGSGRVNRTLEVP